MPPQPPSEPPKAFLLALLAGVLAAGSALALLLSS